MTIDETDAPGDVVLRLASWDDAGGAALREAQQAEIRARYGGESEPGIKPSASDISVFVIAYDPTTSTPLGCGALRDLEENTVELKRMYVHPTHRGRGIGGRVLNELEAQARQRGATRIRLETGHLQPEAIRLYERAGYRQIPNFGPYIGEETSMCFERILDPDFKT